MKLDDPNHDPSQPMTCKHTIERQLDPALDATFFKRVDEIQDLRRNVQYATLESYLRWKGWTDDLRIHKEIRNWEHGAE